MRHSFHLSNLCLRISLAIVFLWFGIDKFVHPQYWLDAWVPRSVLNVLAFIKISGRDFIYINGVFEILVGISLLANLFTKVFSSIAIVFLMGVLVVHGFNEVIIRDIAMIGAFLAIIFWPDKRF